MVDIENILASLYAHEINVSLAWGGDYGFRATLGNPPLGKKSSGRAVRLCAVGNFPQITWRRRSAELIRQSHATLAELGKEG